MIIFPKKDIIPIIIPQIYFKDKYNDINSYNLFLVFFVNSF